MKFQIKQLLTLGLILAGIASNSYTGCLVPLVTTEENLALLLITEDEEPCSCIAL